MTSTDDLAPTDDPRPDGLRRADSLVVVNTGNGKGKSSAAFGMMTYRQHSQGSQTFRGLL